MLPVPFRIAVDSPVCSFIESMVQVKKAAALANLAAGELDEKRAKAIAAACDEKRLL